ncbi:MAG: hypothetical protein JJ992_24725 [Planctomycetes bacterium]|nr:hypothetical protein [Planctomycetota bacterium]
MQVVPAAAPLLQLQPLLLPVALKVVLAGTFTSSRTPVASPLPWLRY